MYMSLPFLFVEEWKKWYDDESLETLPIPTLEDRIQAQTNGEFMRMLLIRAMRDDRGKKF